MRTLFHGFLIILFLFSSISSKAQMGNTSCEEIPLALSCVMCEGVSGPVRSSFEFKEVAWNWDEVGPNMKPDETNPGGSAIPAHAIGRGNGSGRIQYILVNPDEEDNVFACSPTGGLFVSWDGGESWELGGTDILPISGVSSVAIDPFDPHHWVVSTGDGDEMLMYSDGVWRTYNAGQTWENINGGKESFAIPVAEEKKDRIFISKIIANPYNFNELYAVTTKGLFFSKNTGESDPSKIKWRKVLDGSFYDVEFAKGEAIVLVAGSEKFLWIRKGEKDWNRIDLPESDNRMKYKFSRVQIEGSDQDSEHLYAMITRSGSFENMKESEGQLYKFDLEDKTWSYIAGSKSKNLKLSSLRARAFDVHPKDTTLIICGNIQPLFRSDDGGRTFEKTERGQMHDDVHHLLFSPDSSRVWAAHDGGVSVSYDQGLTWESRDKGIGATNVFGLSVAQTVEDRVLIGTYDTGGMLLKQGSWKHVTWGDGFDVEIDASDEDLMFASKQNGHIYRSMDGGEDWEISVSPELQNAEWHTRMKLHPAYSNMVYYAGNKLIRSTSFGESWEIIFDPEPMEGRRSEVGDIYLSDMHPEVMYVWVNKGVNAESVLYRTFNLNQEKASRIRWEKLTLPRMGDVAGLAIDADDGKRFWLIYWSLDPVGKMYRYTGSKWVDIGKGMGFALPESLILEHGEDERLYVGSNYGVFTRSKHEGEWTLLGGLPGTRILAMDINYTTEKLWVGTFGRGVWKADLYKPEVE